MRQNKENRQIMLCVKKVKNYAELSKEIAQEIIGQLKRKPSSVLALASGNTPRGAYKELAKAYGKRKVSFSRAYFVELDEYIGASDERDTLTHYFEKNLFAKFNFKKKNIMLFNTDRPLRTECARFESFIARKGIDLLLLGIGANAHIGFNEPGASFVSKTRVVKLKRSTIERKRKGMKGRPPRRAITLGLSTLMKAKRIVLAASGAEKAKAISKTLKGKPNKNIPSSILRNHKNATIIVDEDAGKLI
ncbi:MAG: glucosamine-6-phosphate deaminase [Candidatus Diapherotrites archaeon]